jgi:hypothetical protein
MLRIPHCLDSRLRDDGKVVSPTHPQHFTPQKHYYFNVEYAIRKVQENQVGLKLNGTHQLLAYADDVNLLGDNIETTKKNTESLIDAGKEIGL